MNFTATLIGQMLAFGIFVWFVMQFVWPPLMRALDERRNKIADGLAAAEKGKQDMASAEKKANEALNEAKQRAAEIVAQSEKRAVAMVEEAKATARAEADRIIAAAKAEIEQETNRAKEVLRDEVAQLAVAGAEKILRRTVDSAAHADLLAQLKQEL